MVKRPELTSAPSAETPRQGPAVYGVIDEQGGVMNPGSTAQPVLEEARLQQMQDTKPRRDNTSKADEDDDDDDMEDGMGSDEEEGDGPANERTGLIKRSRRSAGRKKPWYRRANPWYIHIHMLGFALGMALIAAPKVELFTQVICKQINEDAVLHPPGSETPILLLTPEQCRHSTLVNRRFSELTLLFQVIMGTLCVLTTTYWGSLSDRIGRKRTMSLNILSFALGDVVLVSVLGMPDKFSYYWLLLAPAVEGVFGGFGGGQAIFSAYISDCTDAGSRAGTFSLMMGILFGGIAAGPAISSFLIQITGKLLAPFWACLAIHTLQTIYCLTILPESLSKKKQKEARHLRDEKQIEKREARQHEVHKAEREGYGIARRAWIIFKQILRPFTAIFAPLALLGPREKGDGTLDWSLPMVALASAFYSMIMSVYPIKMQYAQLKFGWTAVELGNLLSLMGVTRIVALLVIIPLLCKLVRKPHQEPVRDAKPSDATLQQNQPASIGASDCSTEDHDAEWDKHKAQHRLIHDYKWDLLLTRVSVVIDTVCYIALTFSKTATYFCVFTVAQSLGSGANPALSSLALMFARPEETGKLMSAMGVFQILMGQIFAPVLFNGIFAATVDFWPEAFFLVGATLFFSTFVTLLFVRVRRPKWTGTHAPEAGASEFSGLSQG